MTSLSEILSRPHVEMRLGGWDDRGTGVQGHSTCQGATDCSSVQQVVSGCSCPSHCTQTARGQERQTASHRFLCLCILHQRASKIWAEVIPILAPVWAPSQAHTVKSPHWHCYSDHSSTEKEAGCAHAWLSLGPNLLSILQGSNHNNGGLAKSKEVGGLFIWLNKPGLNAQITTTGGNPLQQWTILFLKTSTRGRNNNRTLKYY